MGLLAGFWRGADRSRDQRGCAEGEHDMIVRVAAGGEVPVDPTIWREDLT